MKTPPVVARAFTAALFGDPDYKTPDGVEVAIWFTTLPEEEAFREYRQVRQLPEGFRPRDVMERIGEDVA